MDDMQGNATEQAAPARIVVMGVAGCGKSTVGADLAGRLGARFLDGDDFHPPENVAKMSAGTPLTDADRWPWLDRLCREMDAVVADSGRVVLACSALKRAYRTRLTEGSAAPPLFVHLAGSQALIGARLAARRDHYMPPALLDSQFAALEPLGADEHAFAASIDAPADQVTADILRRLKGD